MKILLTVIGYIVVAAIILGIIAVIFAGQAWIVQYFANEILHIQPKLEGAQPFIVVLALNVIDRLLFKVR